MPFRFYNTGKISKDQIRYVSVSIRCDTKWLFVTEDLGLSWDLITFKTDSSTSYEDAIRKILAEYLEKVPDLIREICPFYFEDEKESGFGILYFASLDAFCPKDPNRIKLFHKLPESLVCPERAPRLFFGTQGWLNMQTNADELWDVYDADRNLTGRLHRRGDFLEDGEYHLVVHIWLLNSKNEFLLTKRAPNKGFPNTWETSGGAAQAGDDSLKAALREVREETGLTAYPENAKRIFTFKREDDFCDVWLVRQDFDLKDVVLLEGETVDKMYCDIPTLQKMYSDRELIHYSYFNDLLDLIKTR